MIYNSSLIVKCSSLWFARATTNDRTILKLAEIELIYSEVKEYPILLLDDVLSELDDYRQSHLLNTIQGKVQTFVTTTSVDGIEHETLKMRNNSCNERHGRL